VNNAWTPRLNTTAALANVTKTLNTTVGIRIEWQVWCNDTSNNWNNTGLQFLITIGYALNLRAMDWDLADAISGAYVYKDSDVQISDANGWANWTNIVGTVQIRVQYYGFWVNGTFGVAMDADKNINVQCNLFDVIIRTQEDLQSAYLVGANVTAFNSTSVVGNKIISGTTNGTGYVRLTNLPNATLTFTCYAKSDYSLVIKNVTQAIGSDEYSFTITCDQNKLTTSTDWWIVGFMGMVLPYRKKKKEVDEKRTKRLE
jgi:hypothetical protein